jgi:hypothetical protein
MVLTYHNVRVKVGAEIIREVVPVEAHPTVTPDERNDLAATSGLAGVKQRFGLGPLQVRLLSATRVRGIKPVQL